MIFYHGSKEIINVPTVKGSNPENDYGSSFYLTKDIEAAKSWACRNNKVGVINKFMVKETTYKRLKILDLTDKTKYSVLNWLAILLKFRKVSTEFKKNNKIIFEWIDKYYIDVNDFDIVIGYRADDAYFRFPISFINGEISLEDLEEVYELGDLGIQYAFMSKRAIKSLEFLESIKCESTYIGTYFNVAVKGSNSFNEILSKPKDLNKKYILDLMREDNEH